MATSVCLPHLMAVHALCWTKPRLIFWGACLHKHALSRVCARATLGNFLYILFSIFLYFSNFRFENQAVYVDYIPLYDNSRQTIATTIAVFRKLDVSSRLYITEINQIKAILARQCFHFQN